MWVSAALTYSDYWIELAHFAFGFTTRPYKDLTNFSFLLLNKEGESTKFEESEKRVPLLNFRINILKW